MHWSGLSRPLAALLAAWIAVVMAEPAALHRCAMHAGATSATGAARSAPHAAPHAAHAPVAASGAQGVGHQHDAPESASPDDASAPDGRAACTCLGHCSGTAPLVLGPLAPDLRASLVSALPRPYRATHEYLAAWIDFVLPFATAPPVALEA